MTSIDDMASEIMKGLTEYAELADTAMKKAVRKTATAVKNAAAADTAHRHDRGLRPERQKSDTNFQGGMIYGFLQRIFQFKRA